MEKSTQEHWDNSYSHRRDINPNWKPIYYDYRSIAHVIENTIDTFKPKSIFEVGCGDSVFLPYFLKNLKIPDVAGGGLY